MTVKLAKPRVDLGIVTGRLEAMLGFYRDLLGFDPVIVVPRDSGDIHVLAVGDALVKLVDAPGAPQGPKGEIGAATGLRYLSLWLTDLDEVLQMFRSAGVDIVRAPREVAPGTTAVLVADPDGNVVELLEERPQR